MWKDKIKPFISADGIVTFSDNHTNDITSSATRKDVPTYSKKRQRTPTSQHPIAKRKKDTVLNSTTLDITKDFNKYYLGND